MRFLLQEVRWGGAAHRGVDAYARHGNGENDGCHDDEPWNDGCGNPGCAGSPSSGGSSSNDGSFWNGGCA